MQVEEEKKQKNIGKIPVDLHSNLDFFKDKVSLSLQKLLGEKQNDVKIWAWGLYKFFVTDLGLKESITEAQLEAAIEENLPEFIEMCKEYFREDVRKYAQLKRHEP